jgi:tetratricopeptide (TPR) repeat protein
MLGNGGAVTRATYQVISVAEAEGRFSVSGEVEHPFAKYPEQEIRLYSGGLRVPGDFDSDNSGDWCDHNTIVDGDLVLDGDLSWWDYAGGCFLLVTGDLRARNVLLQGCPNVVVRGDLTVTGGVQGHRGEDGGRLVVGGRTTATIVLNTLYFEMRFGRQPEAVVAGSAGNTECPVDFDEADLSEVVLPELLDEDGTADEYRIEAALRAGQAVLRPTAVPSHLATLAELDRLLADPERVTELDLSDRKLRSFPEQLFRFRNLHTLSLAGNDLIEALPDRLGELTALAELDLSRMGLTALPRSIGHLRALRALDLSYNPLRSLPDRLGNLPRLAVLRGHYLACPLPETLARLTSLVELDLYGLEPPPVEHDVEYDEDGEPVARPLPFPRVVTRLTGLRRLDLSKTRLASLPDGLLRLTSLEELSLDGAVGLVDRLPDLRRLPRLRVLHLNGLSANYGPYPSPRLLGPVWSVGTLEELGLSRWGEETEYNPETRRHEMVRPALAGLPAEAFARMPRLRRLDLSFNAFTTLPESLYGLTELAELDLEYTALDRATIARLVATFPKTRLDLRHIDGDDQAELSDDPTWRRVHELVAEGGTLLAGRPDEAVERFEQALARCVPGARFAEYDQLYALYGTVEALGHLRLETTGEQHAALTERLVRHAERALSLVPAPGSIFHFTDLGAFQEELTRRAGNALAWVLMERGELERALAVIDRALTVADGAESDYVRDTKVRILLVAGRPSDAYRIVDQVLSRDPDFDDFQDLKDSPEFLSWRRVNT